MKDITLKPILYDSNPLAYAIFNMIMILCFLFIASNVFITIIFIEFEKTRANNLKKKEENKKKIIDSLIQEEHWSNKLVRFRNNF